MRRTSWIPLLAGMLLLSAPGCSSVVADLPGSVVRDGDVVRGTGTVLWFSIEGGFYAIQGDDGVAYDPINLPRDLHVDGRKVDFHARIRRDLAGFHMVGPIVELIEISPR